MADTWDKDLRRVIKREHGKGWLIRDMRGGTQLARLESDRTRTTGQLQIPFNASNSRRIAEAVADAIELVKTGTPLAEACTRVAGRPDKPKGIDWQQVAGLHHRTGCTRLWRSHRNSSC